MLFTFYPLLLWLGAPRVKVQVKAFTSLLRLSYVCSSRAVYYWIGSYLVRLDFPGTGGQGCQTPRISVNAWPRVYLQLYRFFSRVCLRAHGCTFSYTIFSHGCTYVLTWKVLVTYDISSKHISICEVTFPIWLCLLLCPVSLSVVSLLWLPCWVFQGATRRHSVRAAIDRQRMLNISNMQACIRGWVGRERVEFIHYSNNLDESAARIQVLHNSICWLAFEWWSVC